jgi:hypothetical protein
MFDDRFYGGELFMEFRSCACRHCPYTVFRNVAIVSNDYETVRLCLGHQHAIEGIPVQPRQGACLLSMEKGDR